MAVIRKSTCLLLLLAAVSLPSWAQKKVSADAEIKTVAKGKLSTVTKSVYCTSNGRLVTLFKTPAYYYFITNTKGEARFYTPSTGEVLSQYDPSMSSNSELVMLFLGGHADDLGLAYYGYKTTATSREEGYIKKKFTPADTTLPSVEIVYENYLPIYCEYTAPDGKLLSRKYLDEYTRYGRFILPLRITDISYGPKDRDSTVVRTIYSGVKVDVDDPAFSFEVPADAVPMKLQGEGK
mgnify:CR=1 FL=1